MWKVATSGDGDDGDDKVAIAVPADVSQIGATKQPEGTLLWASVE